MPSAPASRRRRRDSGADPIDTILAQWRRERPDLSQDSMAALARVVLLAARMDRAFEAVARRHGLTRGLTDVLAALRRSGPPYRMMPTALFNSMMVTSGGMTHRLDRLERKGLVERRRHPDDKRGVHVALTAKGRSVIDALLPESIGLMDRWLSPLSSAERRQLAGLLQRVLGAGS